MTDSGEEYSEDDNMQEDSLSSLSGDNYDTMSNQQPQSSIEDIDVGHPVGGDPSSQSNLNESGDNIIFEYDNDRRGDDADHSSSNEISSVEILDNYTTDSTESFESQDSDHDNDELNGIGRNIVSGSTNAPLFLANDATLALGRIWLNRLRHIHTRNAREFRHEQLNNYPISRHLSNIEVSDEIGNDAAPSILLDSSNTTDPLDHSYLSGSFDKHSSAVHFDYLTETVMPVLILSNVALMPTQIVPLQLFVPNLVTAMRQLIQDKRTFGVLRDYDQTKGTTAEIILIGRQRFQILAKYAGNEDSDRIDLSEAFDSFSYTAKVRILPNAISSSRLGCEVSHNQLTACRCADELHIAIVSGKAESYPGRCSTCRYARHLVHPTILNMYNQDFLAAKIIIKIETICRTVQHIPNEITTMVNDSNDGDNDDAPLYLSEHDAKELDPFKRLCYALAVQNKTSIPFKSFLARIAMEVVRTSGVDAFIYWLLRNVPLISQKESWNLLHEQSSNVERFHYLIKTLENNDSDSLCCRNCGLRITSLSYLFSMCRKILLPDEPYVSEEDYPELDVPLDSLENQRIDFCRPSGENTSGENESSTVRDGPPSSNASTSEKFVHIPGDICVTFVNPNGSVFETMSTSRALNYIENGQPTFHYSWYDQYAWTTITCNGCYNQLGWKFRSLRYLNRHAISSTRFIRNRVDNAYAERIREGDQSNSSESNSLPNDYFGPTNFQVLPPSWSLNMTDEYHNDSVEIPTAVRTGPWSKDLRIPKVFFGFTRDSLQRGDVEQNRSQQHSSSTSENGSSISEFI
ncbi:hypothetical protein GJ496_010479 [Pomphorhynchus laevis]|nr:hypothetical protein GJ496_010479 [Pomphorhynchus laevis]